MTAGANWSIPGGKMEYAHEEKRKPRIGLVIGVIIGLLFVLGILYLIIFQSAFPWDTAVRARTLTSVYLRQGPGVIYPTTGALAPDTEVTAVGKSNDGSWLVVKTDAGKAWMTGSSKYVEIDAAALAKLPIFEASPLAYDTNNLYMNEVLNQIPLVVYHRDHFTCASHAGLNNLFPSVADGNVIGPHSGDFALIGKGGNVLFEYSQGSLRLIRDNPIARFDGDQKYLPLDTALKMLETGEIVWTGNFGDWPGRGVPGCDESSAPG
jgi:hypothetical protein